MIDLSPLEALVAATGARTRAVDPMRGGASTRRYFRVTREDGATAVGMYVPDAERPEEIFKTALTGGAGAVGRGAFAPPAPRPGRWPFLEVRDLLAENGVRVPRLVGEATKQGWVLLEDLGDETLAAHLEANPGRREALYARAVRDLASAQNSLRSLPPDSVILTRSFDRDLLRWELDHFREWGIDARGHALSRDDARALDGIFDRLAARIAALPRGFVHRDYQSRNLMVTSGDLVWIDFQDALLGPRAYDLVALLFDSYQEIDDAFVKARLDDYAAAASLTAEGRSEIEREVDWIAVQRKLKDAGRFVFIDRDKNDPSFLPYVSSTLRKVSRTLDRWAPKEPDMARLRDILARTMPAEFATGDPRSAGANA